MAKRPGRISGDRAGRSGIRLAGIVGLALFALLDLALVYLALTVHGTPRPSSGIPSSAPSPSAAPTDAEPDETGFEFAALNRLLAPASDTVAWRTGTGDCDSPVAVERTEDAGASWDEYVVEGAGIRSVLALAAIDAVTIRAVVGVGEECEPQQIESFTGGVFWAPVSGSDAYWHDSPLEPGAVIGPDRVATTPCEQISSIAALSDSEAAVVCTNGSLQQTTDSGATWTNPADGSGVRAVAAGGDGFLVARAGTDSCEGLQVALLTTDGPEPRSCVPAVPSDSIAFAARGDVVWMWAGGDVLISADGGFTWAP